MITTVENLRGVSGVYCAIHRDSGWCYVGSSMNIGRRVSDHISVSKKGATNKFHRALVEYGFGAFDFEVLERCGQSVLLDRERFYIVLLGSASTAGFNTRESTTSNYGMVLGPVTRARMSASRMGKKFTPETCAKISAAKMGLKFTPEHRKNLSAKRKWVKLSPQHRANMIAALTGLKRTPETCAKIGALHKGTKHSAESKEKMRVSALRRCRNGKTST